MTTKKGDRLGEWVLLELLGAGAFGEVWRAHAATAEKRLAAVKVPRDDRGADLLRREGAVQARLASPRFPRVLGVSVEPSYVAFELVEGGNLREKLAGGKLPLGEAVSVAREVLLALVEAHAAGIVHRDVKPENVLVGRRVMLTDFGLVSDLSEEMVQSLAEDEALVGTLPYLAPEVREGQRGGPSADVYAWGVVLFELLTGGLPGAAELPSHHGVPVAFDDVYRRAVARMGQRFGSAAEALGAFERAASGVAPPRTRPPLPSRKPEKKVDVRALLERVASEEAELLAREFVAFVTIEGRATTRANGKTYTFDVRGEWPGLYVLKARTKTEAIVVRPAGRPSK